MKSLTTALLIFISISALASVKSSATGAKIPAPAFNWGSPDDLDLTAVVLLKNSTSVVAPEFVWGTPEDLNEADLQSLKVKTDLNLALPAFNWGTPEDLDQKELQKLSNSAGIPFPAIIIGDANEIEASDLK